MGCKLTIATERANSVTAMQPAGKEAPWVRLKRLTRPGDFYTSLYCWFITGSDGCKERRESMLPRLGVPTVSVGSAVLESD